MGKNAINTCKTNVPLRAEIAFLRLGMHLKIEELPKIECSKVQFLEIQFME
ncbi:MAG: hypothetical protein ACXV8U_09080 [Methylobacter sp.]